MTPVQQARTDLADVLKTLAPNGIRFYELGDDVDPPAVVVGPPMLTWTAYVSDPTTARFAVYLIAAMDDRAIDRLLELLPLVVEAVESLPDAVITTAIPSVWTAGVTDLPDYEITVEVAL